MALFSHSNFKGTAKGGRIGPSPPQGEAAADVAERVSIMQDRVRAFRAPDYGVDDFLGDKHAEAARDA